MLRGVNRVLLVLLLVTGCRTAPPAAEPNRTRLPPPYDWRKDGGLMQGAADERCRKELPDCPRPFATYTMPPSPCAGRGTRCLEMPERDAGRWSCGCDACTSPSDCKPGEHCGTSAVDPCSPERLPLRCLAGPPPPAESPCLEPPSARGL